MINFIQSIPGPQFLFFFTCFVLVLIYLGKIFAESDGTQNIEPPEPESLKPVEIAALKGGHLHVLNTVLFNLVNKKVISIEARDVPIKIEDDSIKLTPIQEMVCNCIQSNQLTTEELFSDLALKDMIVDKLSEFQSRLTSLNILKTDTQKKRLSSISNTLLITIILLGGLKLYLGITHDKPVIFLIIAMVVGVIIQQMVFRSKRELTNCGKRFISLMNQRFSWMQQLKTKDLTEKGINPAYGVAMFGALAVAEIAMFSTYAQALPDTAIKSVGGGFDGGCSGCSGCDGGGCSGCGGCGGCG